MKLLFIFILAALSTAHSGNGALRVVSDDTGEAANHPQHLEPEYHWCGAPDPREVPHASPQIPLSRRRDMTRNETLHLRSVEDIETCTTCTWYQCELSPYFNEEPPVCSDPAVRDQYSSTPSPPLTIRTFIYVLRYSDGSSPIASSSNVNWFKTHMNSAYSPAGIQFDFSVYYADDTALRTQTVLSSGFNSFKSSVHTKSGAPNSKALRIYIANLSGGLLGSATFAYEPDVLDPTGGFIMAPSGVSSSCSGIYCITGPHEAGHCFGLYHTFQDGLGSAPTVCRFCPWVTGGQSSTYLDQTGDMCGDTFWLPTVHDESDPDCYGGSDFCPVGDADQTCTDYDCTGWTINIPHSIIEDHGKNFMSYLGCNTKEFTPKQMARMRCFIDYYYQDAMVGGSGGVPDDWTCNPDWYTDSWCDCGCGAYDPTCDDPDAPLYVSCASDEACSLDPAVGCYGEPVISKVKIPAAQIHAHDLLVRWTMVDPLVPVTSFHLQKRIYASGKWQKWTNVNKNIGGSKNKFRVKNLLSGRKYQFRLRGKNAAPTSPGPWKNSKAVVTN